MQDSSQELYKRKSLLREIIALARFVVVFSLDSSFLLFFHTSLDP